MSTPRSLAPLVLALALQVPVVACASTPAQDASAVRAQTSTRVLAISIDGLNPSAIRQLGRSGAPTFYRLMDEGAFTLNARTEFEQTVTLPNHTSMMTGRRIDRTHGGHGVTWDDDRPGTTVQGAAGHGVSSIFTIVNNHGGSTALFSTKPKFALYNRSWDKGIDTFTVNEDQPALVKAARSDLIHQARDFTFLHVSLPDRAGHETGFMSPGYVAAVGRTDALLGKLMGAIDTNATLRESLVVVLTADHGGKGKGHSDRTKLGNYRVPFIVWGPGVTHGHLYAMNPSYQNPGTRRPTYAGNQPVRNGDQANLAADLLELDSVPGSEFDFRQWLDVS